jgi:hypothetical protein
MTTGHDNWNGYHFGASWCFGGAPEMLRGCCRGVIAALLLLLLGAKQAKMCI